MDDMEAEEFQVAFFKLADFVVPKLAREEQIADEDNEINININYVKSTADKENRIME